jgi:hypothetical protein
MHVPLADRTRAFRKLVMLLAVTQAEIERLARAHGAFVEKATDSKDKLGRRAVNWTQLAVRLPRSDNGMAALLLH